MGYTITIDDNKGLDASVWNLAWTHEPPTKPGWYFVWFVHPNTESAGMQYVAEHNEELMIPIDSEGGIYETIEDYGHPLVVYWFGPLPMPEKPKELNE